MTEHAPVEIELAWVERGDSAPQLRIKIRDSVGSVVIDSTLSRNIQASLREFIMDENPDQKVRLSVPDGKLVMYEERHVE